MNILRKQWVVGPFQCNCRLIACPRTGEAALVDPGDEAALLLKELGKITLADGSPIRVKWLLHTHGHLDHIGATRELREAGSAPAGVAGLGESKIALHRGDEPIYQALKMQGRMFGFGYEDPLPVEHYLEDAEELRIGSLRLTVLHTPGHSPGSVSMRLHEDSEIGLDESVLTGDTLFMGSVGRSDLWGADQEQMFRSIRERLLSLDDDTAICPGHGPDSSIGRERRENPFL